MAQFFNTFTAIRVADLDGPALLTQLQALDASATVQHVPGTQIYVLGKNTAWTAGQISAAQNVIETAATASAELSAQADIDAWPIALKALALALIDQLNVIRAALPVPLGAITPAQAIAAIRNKAASL